MKKSRLMIALIGLLFCFTGCNINQTEQEPTTTPQIEPIKKPQTNILDENVVFSENYLVGFDYGSYDLYGMCPIVICKVRFDKTLEVDFTMPDSSKSDIRTYDLTDEQFNNIVAGIDVREIYTLDPEEANPEEVFDGGSVWLFVYGENDEVIKQNGGFCPENESFNQMRRVLFDNLPEEFRSEYDEFEERSYGTENGMDYYVYDIEAAVADSVFSDIIQGEVKPVKVVYGRGGEFGYEQFISTEETMIECILDGLRLFTVKEVVDDGSVSYTADGNEDITFFLEDGTKSTVSIDNKNYIHTRENYTDVVYIFDNCNKLTSFEEMMVEGKQFSN